ncbi:MAG: hypothetical protein AB7U73_04715 [Pirellulales bacterium]
MIVTLFRSLPWATLCVLGAVILYSASAAGEEKPTSDIVPAAAGDPGRPATDDPRPPTPSDLDRALLESLEESFDEEPAPPRRDKPAAKPTDRPAADDEAQRDQPAASDSLDDSLDDELLRDLGPVEGEVDDTDDPLTRIGRKMQEAQRLIAQRQPGEPAQKLQTDIVNEIDELLKQARQQQSQQQSSSSKQRQQSRRDKADQPQPEPGSGQPEEAGNEPSRDSTDRLRPEAVAEPDVGQMQDLLRELWGHLPEHERQQVINSTIEKFVPKYESLIKEYFKRLSEATRSQP